jgi:hypothetical protein
MENVMRVAADRVYAVLHDKVAIAKSRVPDMTGLPRDLANQAIGWLACQGKIGEEELRGRKVLTVRATK